MIQLAALFKTLNPQSNTALFGYIVTCLLSTLYCLAWDYYMDWGLIRSNEKGKKYLRPKILYPVWFYYYAMISNMFMRFFWVLSVFNFPPWVN